MITEAEFKILSENAKKFKYSRFEYWEYSDEIACANIIRNDDKLILVSREIDEIDKITDIYFAADNAANVTDALEDVKEDIQIGFVPSDLVEVFEEAGFIVWSEWIDFFNNDINNTPTEFKDYDAIQFLKPDENFDVYIKDMTTIGADLSRGFTEEKGEWFIEWARDNDIIIIKDGDSLAGICCVSVYDNGNTVWIRRIAVKAEYQGMGFGKKLMEQALAYGINKGAKRAFLAADTLNVNAIALYKKCGFIPQGDRGEITIKRLGLK